MEAVSNGGSLRGCVTVVAGATRGAGRGIAAALGEAGAIVICTGRSTARADASTASDYDRPETIEETAELVTSLGGVGVPIAVDHLDTGQVAALAERIRSEYGRIDVLVNDIWGAERLKGAARLEYATLETRSAKRTPDSAPRYRDASGDIALPAAAAYHATWRPARGGYRRHGRVQICLTTGFQCSTTSSSRA
jgi:NAD(P)-dependent dehydrogenase (short-subunit alcohol dehydrogenase family)